MVLRYQLGAGGGKSVQTNFDDTLVIWSSQQPWRTIIKQSVSVCYVSGLPNISPPTPHCQRKMSLKITSIPQNTLHSSSNLTREK